MTKSSSLPPAIPAAYPSTIIYVSGVCIFAAFLGGKLPLNVSLLTFTLIYVLVAFSSVNKELRRVQANSEKLVDELASVHELVNSESQRQLDRIEMLERLLTKAGEPVPNEKKRDV